MNRSQTRHKPRRRAVTSAEPRALAASLIQLFVMGAVYDAVQTGALATTQSTPDLSSMIAASDNDACNGW